MSDETFLPLRHDAGAPPTATHVRSTLIVSGIQAFRARGHLPRYLQALDESARTQLLSLVAGQWIPLELGLVHYRAADSLGLETSVIEAIGAEVADRVNRSALSVMVKMSRQAGVTPWTALASSHRINEANWRGTDVTVLKKGPKDAQYEWYGQPCASVPYFVVSCGSFLRSLAALFCEKAYCRVSSQRCSATRLSYRLSWA